VGWRPGILLEAVCLLAKEAGWMRGWRRKAVVVGRRSRSRKADLDAGRMLGALDIFVRIF